MVERRDGLVIPEERKKEEEEPHQQRVHQHEGFPL